MLFLDHAFSAKDAMFKEAAAVGAAEIRLDIAVANVFPVPDGAPDWSGVDQYVVLARRYHLRVLANLLATPWYLAACPAGTAFGDSYRCPASDPTRCLLAPTRSSPAGACNWPIWRRAMPFP